MAAMSLERFKRAQEDKFAEAFAEISDGHKSSHWMWYIFPQLKGLGRSSTAIYYGLDGEKEAREYYSDEVLRGRLISISQELLKHGGKDIKKIMGEVDAIKLRSCMTLFESIGGDRVFSDVLNRFFGGRRDKLTLDLLAARSC